MKINGTGSCIALVYAGGIGVIGAIQNTHDANEKIEDAVCGWLCCSHAEFISSDIEEFTLYHERAICTVKVFDANMDIDREETVELYWTTLY